MLGNRNAAANIAVRNLDTARKFFEGTLGLKQIGMVAIGDAAICTTSGF